MIGYRNQEYDKLKPKCLACEDKLYYWEWDAGMVYCQICQVVIERIEEYENSRKTRDVQE